MHIFLDPKEIAKGTAVLKGPMKFNCVSEFGFVPQSRSFQIQVVIFLVF